MENPFTDQIIGFAELIGAKCEQGIRDEGYGDLLDDYLANRDAFDRAVIHFNTDGYGATFKHAKQERWAVLMPDAGAEGMVRYQEFGPGGFIGHSTHCNDEHLLEALVSQGYTAPAAKSTLEQLSQTESWRKGSERLLLIQALNANQITVAEFTEQVSAFAA